MDSWFYKLFGDTFGPVSLDELIEMAKSHILSSDDEVRFGESGSWRRAGSMGQLMAHMPSGSHVPSLTPSTGTALPPNQDLLGTLPKSVVPMGWYYKIFGAEFGPVTLKELVEVAKSHALSSDDDVRFGENGAWRQAGAIGQLMAHLPFQARKQPAASTPNGTEIDSQGSDRAETTPSATSSMATSNDGISSNIQDSPPDQVWWCKIQKKEYGPIDLPKLIEWAGTGRLHRDDQIRNSQNAYILASGLPGLFPELPSSLPVKTTPETAITPVDKSAPKEPASSSAPKPSSAAAGSSSQNESGTANGKTDPTTTPKPAAQTMANSGVAPAPAANRAPVRRPAPKSSSGNLRKLVVPALGVAAVALVGALIYVVILFLPPDNTAANKSFKALRTAYGELGTFRSGDSKLKPDDFKPIAEKLASAAKPVVEEMKGKTSPVQKKLLSLAKKLQSLAKEESLVQPVELEKTIDKTIDDLAKLLGT